MLNSSKSLVALIIIILMGCQQNKAHESENKPATDSGSQSETVTPKNEEKVVQLHLKGTIKLINLEGGFYGIVTDSGQKVLPMNLNPEYLQDGAVIEFSGNYKNVMTIQQWGKPFTVTEIKIIKEGKKNSTRDEF